MSVQRGMIELTIDGMKMILELIQDLPHYPTELPPRLQAALQVGQNPTQVELSEDSAEAILDSLPMPQTHESIQISQIRQKVSQFLYHLRHAQTAIK